MNRHKKGKERLRKRQERNSVDLGRHAKKCIEISFPSINNIIKMINVY